MEVSSNGQRPVRSRPRATPPVAASRVRHEGPPLWHATVLVPAALMVSLLSPELVTRAELGVVTPFARLAAQGLAMALGFLGWYQADQADVPPRMNDENLRVILVLGGLVAIMFAAAFGWLALLDVLGALL